MFFINKKPLCICLFFFSSRRRHTRSYGDWSSDVCSSDLKIWIAAGAITRDAVGVRGREGYGASGQIFDEDLFTAAAAGHQVCGRGLEGNLRAVRREHRKLASVAFRLDAAGIARHEGERARHQVLDEDLAIARGQERIEGNLRAIR